MKIVEIRPYSWDSHRVYIAFVGFPPYLHRIRGIPTVFISFPWNSHLIYIVFAGFPPSLHHIRGIPTLFTSYIWDSHRIYIIFVGSHRFHIVFPGIQNPGNPPFPLDKCVYTWYSSLYFSVIYFIIVEGCLLIFYGQSLYVGELH